MEDDARRTVDLQLKAACEHLIFDVSHQLAAPIMMLHAHMESAAPSPLDAQSINQALAGWGFLFFQFVFALTRVFEQPPVMQSRKTGQLQVTRPPPATLAATPYRKVYGSAHILPVAVTLISVYIPNRVTQSVLLHPIRNNISASVQQLADVAKGMALPVDAQQVGIASLAAAL